MQEEKITSNTESAFDPAAGDMPLIRGRRKTKRPRWAELEWVLIREMEAAVEVFMDKYVRDDGTLRWRDYWPGMDGADDAFESFQNYPLFYALGASSRLLGLSHRQWDSVAWQWTEYGQLHHEFFRWYDWMHHGEGSLFLYYMGLADPASLKFLTRTLRFASLYDGSDSEVQNYDPEKRMMLSPINGSGGPRLKHSAEDWETHREVLDHYLPPFEDLPGIPFVMKRCDWSGDATYRTILAAINERMAEGDVPLNLNATSLLTHACLYTGDERYRDRVVEYLDAWLERTRLNGGIIPDNIGPDGVIGSRMEGKWWGGYYGWRWPHGALTIIEPTLTAGINALLLTGDRRHLELARSQMDRLYDLHKLDEAGIPLVPQRHFDTGWADYRPENTKWPVYLWSVSQADEDLARIARLPNQDSWGAVPTVVEKGNRMAIHPWYHYVQGLNPAYPEAILEANIAAVKERVNDIENDADDVSGEDIHHWQDKNPVICEALVQLMLGGSTNIYHGGLMHTALRYFHDGRPGLPRDVGALVESIAPDHVVVQYHNGGSGSCRFIIQGGCFGEHRFSACQVLDAGESDSQTFPENSRWLAVELDAGVGMRLRLDMQRYTGKPDYRSPWMEEKGWPQLIRQRQIEMDEA